MGSMQPYDAKVPLTETMTAPVTESLAKVLY